MEVGQKCWLTTFRFLLPGYTFRESAYIEIYIFAWEKDLKALLRREKGGFQMDMNSYFFLSLLFFLPYLPAWLHTCILNKNRHLSKKKKSLQNLTKVKVKALLHTLWHLASTYLRLSDCCCWNVRISESPLRASGCASVPRSAGDGVMELGRPLAQYFFKSGRLYHLLPKP